MKRTLAILISLFVVSAAACDGDNGPTGLCGNGVIDTLNGEGCDGDDLGGMTCEGLGFNAISSGALKCNVATCLFNTEECLGPIPCGDGFLDTGIEVCEPDDLNGMTCELQGLEAGMLECADGCVDFDRSGCGCSADVDLGTWSGTPINETFDSCAGTTLYGNRPFVCGAVIGNDAFGGPWPAVGEERVFALTLAAGASVKAVHTGGANTDTMIYVLTDCTDIFVSSCVDGDDSTTAGGAETALISNDTDAPVTYYIVADSYDGCDSGATLEITAQ